MTDATPEDQAHGEAWRRATSDTSLMCTDGQDLEEAYGRDRYYDRRFGIMCALGRLLLILDREEPGEEDQATKLARALSTIEDARRALYLRCADLGLPLLPDDAPLEDWIDRLGDAAETAKSPAQRDG